MPLAVKRLRLQDLPVTLSLGDGDAMMPALKLSAYDQVIVGARVSLSGNPVAQNGDFYTELGSVDNVNPPPQINLVIDQVKGTAAAPAGARQLSLRVDISSELRAKADPQTAVFVYAKAMQGPPMPLAVKRLKLQDLPVTLSLGDGDAMMPSMKLSAYDQVIVGARVSFSGNPVAQNGDFYTELGSVNSANPPPQISLVIDQVR
jgi:hypothetical protein